MKSRLLTIAIVVAVIAAASALFALLSSARQWDRQKAARLRDFTDAERAVAWQQRAARNDQDESQLTQMERDLQSRTHTDCGRCRLKVTYRWLAALDPDMDGLVSR